jgi:AcrR family transcriptional regulator
MSQTAPQLRSRLRDAASDVMLQAAEQVMCQKGFDGATMQDIAAAAGCAVGTLYLHFKNKEQLLGGILLKYGTGLAEDIRTAVQATDDPLDKLRIFISAHLEWIHRHPAISELIGRSLPMRYYEFKASLGKILPAEQGEMQRLELQLIREAQAAGCVRTDIPAEPLTELVDGFLLTVMDQYSARPHTIGIEQQVELCWGFLVSGLQAGVPARKSSQPKKKHA